MVELNNIVLVGRFGTGKSTVAQVLVDEYGYGRASLASNIKSLARDAYGTLDKGKHVRVTSRDGKHRDITIRQVLQELGEAVKDMDRDLWLRLLLNDIQFATGPLVVDDARFPFEAEALRQRGWVIARLYAPQMILMERYKDAYGRLPTEAEMNHVSETQSDFIRPDIELNAELPPEMLAEALVAHEV